MDSKSAIFNFPMPCDWSQTLQTMRLFVQRSIINKLKLITHWSSAPTVCLMVTESELRCSPCRLDKEDMEYNGDDEIWWDIPPSIHGS